MVMMKAMVEKERTMKPEFERKWKRKCCERLLEQQEERNSNKQMKMEMESQPQRLALTMGFKCLL